MNTEDVILKLPAWLNRSTVVKSRTSLTLIFFITGNPGLISYYKTFLDLIWKGVANDAIVAGVSLAGFERNVKSNDALSRVEDELLRPPGFVQKPIYDLKDQVHIAYARLGNLVNNVKQEYENTAELPCTVILMGHSVGAYIALEIVRLHYASLGSVPILPFHITATMLLTPTIYDISKSPSGRIATPILSNIPFFPGLVQLGASSLVSVMPTNKLKSIISTITGMPTGNALDSTTAFLQTPGAVRQALFMAKHEMLEIGEDRWTNDVWGTSTVTKTDLVQTSVDGEISATNDAPKWQAPRHFFLFAREDHWVADATRETIIGQMQSQAQMVVDHDGKLGIAHAWCIKQNEAVANIVGQWLRETTIV